MLHGELLQVRGVLEDNEQVQALEGDLLFLAGLDDEALLLAGLDDDSFSSLDWMSNSATCWA